MKEIQAGVDGFLLYDIGLIAPMQEVNTWNQLYFKGRWMGCFLWETHLRLTNTRFCICILHIRMNYCEMYLMVTSRVTDYKGLRMTIYLGYFSDKKGNMANVMLQMLNVFLWYESWCAGIQKVCVFTNGYKFWIKSKWLFVVDIPAQSLLTILSFIDLAFWHEFFFWGGEGGTRMSRGVSGLSKNSRD